MMDRLTDEYYTVLSLQCNFRGYSIDVINVCYVYNKILIYAFVILLTFII